jgi:immune inhibitor A
MRRVLAGVAGIAVTIALPGLATAAPAAPTVQSAPGAPATKAPRSDDLPNPLADKQAAHRARAQEMTLSGQATPSGRNRVVKVGRGQYVELARESEDSIFTVLGEFGTATATHNHDGQVSHGGDPGPLHNQIPEPDRSVDNSTIWTKDFSRAYYEDLLFSEKDGAVSMRNYYLEQSSGRYTVNGDVTDWVKVPGNAASYGANYCGDIVCADTWLFLADALKAWYASEVAAGKSAAEIDDYLSRFDVWDRYDYDGDGNFDEADGYIDHFQAVHAGEGEETGGGAYGEDALWSHRWYANFGDFSSTGPDFNKAGGVKIGGSKYWVGDYTVEPENGGVGVFAHEFGHDLGLPDLYDTSGNTGGAENSTGFWTLMSSGSYGNSGRPEDGIGTKPTHMGAWEKFQLGWLKFTTVREGKEANLTLGPAEHNTKLAQAAFVLLPDKQVPLELGSPFEGSMFYYSDSGDNLDNSMTKQVTIGSGAFTAKVRYDIETDWDYAYLTVDGKAVPTNRSATTNPNSQNLGNGITGSTSDAWVDLTADLSAYAGKSVTLGFRYVTDGAVSEPGFQADAISLDGQPVGTAESDEGWTLNGFRTTTGSEEQSFFNAYVLENRQYIGFDASLRTGPYNFGYLSTKPNWVEHFAYQNGLLVSYWDTSFSDNSVGDHPGGGLILPVDANPGLSHWADGTLMRPRIQTYDATFGLERTQGYTLHTDGVAAQISSKPAVPLFDDSKTYWTDCDAHACTGDHAGRYQPGWSSVDVPDTGTTVRVLETSSNGTVMKVGVNKG